VNILAGIAVGVAVAALALGAVAPGALPPAMTLARDRSRSLASAILAKLREGASSDAIAARSLVVLQMSSTALLAGMPLGPALRLAIGEATPVHGDPFGEVLRAIELNTPLDQALRAAALRGADQRAVRALDAMALVATERLPASRAGAVLASVADRLSYDAQLREDVRARASGVRAQIVLLALLVPALALYLVMTMPGLAATLSSPIGRVVLVPAAAAFEIAGILASRAIVRDIRA
jgi:Flp pilus assembly protein TadB